MVNMIFMMIMEIQLSLMINLVKNPNQNQILNHNKNKQRHVMLLQEQPNILLVPFLPKNKYLPTLILRKLKMINTKGIFSKI